MTTRLSAGPGTSTPCQKLIVANRQAAVRQLSASKQGGLGELSLHEHGPGQPGRELLGGSGHRPAAREQGEGTTAGGEHERLDLVVDGRLRLGAAAIGQRRRAVQQPVRLVGEGAAYVELPGRRRARRPVRPAPAASSRSSGPRGCGRTPVPTWTPLTSSGAECNAGRDPPLTQTTSSLPAARQAASSSRQRSTPKRARRQRWEASPPPSAVLAAAVGPAPAPTPPEASAARRSSSLRRSRRSTLQGHLLADLASQAGRQPLVLSPAEQLLERAGCVQDRLHGSGRGRVLARLRLASRRGKGGPRPPRREHAGVPGSPRRRGEAARTSSSSWASSIDERVVLGKHLAAAAQVRPEKVEVRRRRCRPRRHGPGPPRRNTRRRTGSASTLGTRRR